MSENQIKKASKSNIVSLSVYKQILITAVGCAIFQLLSYIVTSIVVSLLPGDTILDKENVFRSDSIYSMWILTGCYLATFIILVIILLKDRVKVLESLKKWNNYLIGFAFGAGIIIFSLVYGKIIGDFASSNENQQAAVELMSKFPLFGFFIISIIGPIVEEITYRLGLFSLGSRYKKWLGYVLSIVVFALIHINFFSKDIVVELVNLPNYIICGLALGIAYDKFGIATSITAHVTNNMVAFLATFIPNLINNL